MYLALSPVCVLFTHIYTSPIPVLIRTVECSSYCKRAFKKITQDFKLYDFAMHSSKRIAFGFHSGFLEMTYRFT